MKWVLKGEISIYADSGPPRYHVLWSCGCICHKVLTFIKIGCGRTVVSQTHKPPSFFGFFVTFSSHTLSLNQRLRGQNFWRKTFQGKYSRCFLKTGQEYFRTLRWGTTLIYFCESHSKNSQFQAFKKELRPILVTKDNQKDAVFNHRSNF